VRKKIQSGKKREKWVDGGRRLIMVKQNEEPPLLALFSASNHQDAPLTARATLLSQQLTASFMLIKRGTQPRGNQIHSPQSFKTQRPSHPVKTKQISLNFQGLLWPYFNSLHIILRG